jgi:hypothetical protein
MSKLIELGLSTAKSDHIESARKAVKESKYDPYQGRIRYMDMSIASSAKHGETETLMIVGTVELAERVAEHYRALGYKAWIVHYPGSGPSCFLHTSWGHE